MVHLINYNNSIVGCYIIRRKLLSQGEMSLMSGRPIPLVQFPPSFIAGSLNKLLTS